MSNIWHTTKEKPMLHRDIILCGDGWSMPMDIIPETVNNICWKNVEKWCYVDDLLGLETENKDLSDKIGKLETELERTRKALEIAVDALKYANKCIKGGCVNWETEIDKTLEQIIATLENKNGNC